ncbi:unnamed protein product [Discosporangium mesarthrocarpum]
MRNEEFESLTEPRARAALWDLRGQVDMKSSPTEIVRTVATQIALGQGLLSTEANILLDSCPALMELAREGALEGSLQRYGMSRTNSNEEYFLATLVDEVIPELDTSWDVAVKKWRQKALAVEKYRSINPMYVSSVYTFMVNTCIRQRMWEVAYDAMAYAGLLTTGPFFVSAVDIGASAPAVVLDLDKMAAYIAEKILDMDLDAWRRIGGDLEAGKGVVGNNRPGVGIEERNFAQIEESVSLASALRVQDMTLAAARVALRKLIKNMSEGSYAKGADIIMLCSVKTGTASLGDLLLLPRAVIAILALDFSHPLPVDGVAGERLANQPITAKALGMDRGMPIVVRGADVMDWLPRVKEL